MSFRVGQKVVCIVGAPWTSSMGNPTVNSPAEGEVCEIAFFHRTAEELFLGLAEYPGFPTPTAFQASCFRPVVSGEREMEALQALLDDLPKPAPQRILACVLAEAEKRS